MQPSFLRSCVHKPLSPALNVFLSQLLQVHRVVQEEVEVPEEEEVLDEVLDEVANDRLRPRRCCEQVRVQEGGGTE